LYSEVVVPVLVKFCYVSRKNSCRSLAALLASATRLGNTACWF